MEAIKSEIRGKIAELAKRLGNDASSLQDDDVIPLTGLLDSAALFELIIWCEQHFHMQLNQDEINIDNFGTLQAMTDFIGGRRGDQANITSSE
jgi:D-alanine--poly(phosphoribitol) ligase subunit 2